MMAFPPGSIESDDDGKDENGVIKPGNWEVPHQIPLSITATNEVHGSLASARNFHPQLPVAPIASHEATENEVVVAPKFTQASDQSSSPVQRLAGSGGSSP